MKRVNCRGNIMRRRELVAMLMESPFYFDLGPRERLLLLQHHENRFSTGDRRKFDQPWLQVICRHREPGAEIDTLILIPVGSLPRRLSHPAPKPPNLSFPASEP
jgi:hypothetical protein